VGKQRTPHERGLAHSSAWFNPVMVRFRRVAILYELC
jgi:hypothetical protein